MKQFKTHVQENILIYLIMLLAVITRLVYLGKLPDGLHLDEAYAGYISWGLMTEGLDSRGYPYPVYFIAWGEGMNALYSYLAIPFLKLLGVTVFAYRLPQALIGVFCIYIMYDLGKVLFNQKIGYFLAFVLAINPWHIMNTRFIIESNLAPGMFLLAMWLLVYAEKTQKLKYFIFSAIFFGLTLYCYAITWLIVPLFLVLCLLLFYKRIKDKKFLFVFGIILFLLALPLLIFIAINYGWIPEIKTSFFSIPKMLGYRVDELNPIHIWKNKTDILNIILKQYSFQPFAASELVGAYYLFTTPLFLVGIGIHIFHLFKHYQKGENQLQYIFLLWLISAFLVCSMNATITTIHFNMVHIPITFYSAYGTWQISKLLKSKTFLYSCLIFWLISFGIFAEDYIKNGSSAYFYNDTAGEVLDVAKEMAQGEDITIFGKGTIVYNVMLWNELPLASDFAANVVYANECSISTYGQFKYMEYFEFNADMEAGIYIIPYEYQEEFSDIGFEITNVNERYSIAKK